MNTSLTINRRVGTSYSDLLITTKGKQENLLNICASLKGAEMNTYYDWLNLEGATILSTRRNPSH